MKMDGEPGELYGKCCDDLHAWHVKWRPYFDRKGTGYAMVRAGVLQIFKHFEDTEEAKEFLKGAIEYGAKDFIQDMGQEFIKDDTDM